MSYESNLKGRLIIDDNNYERFIDVRDEEEGGYKHKGFSGRDYGAYPFGSLGDRFPQDFYIPSSDWPEMIEQLDILKAQPVHHKRLSGFKSLNQASPDLPKS